MTQQDMFEMFRVMGNGIFDMTRAVGTLAQHATSTQSSQMFACTTPFLRNGEFAKGFEEFTCDICSGVCHGEILLS